MADEETVSKTMTTDARATAVPPWFAGHELLDEHRAKMNEKAFLKARREMKSIHKRLNEMPSKSDIEDLETLIKGLHLGFGALKISAGFLIKLGLTLTAIVAIVKDWKQILVWIGTFLH